MADYLIAHKLILQRLMDLDAGRPADAQWPVLQPGSQAKEPDRPHRQYALTWGSEGVRHSWGSGQRTRHYGDLAVHLFTPVKDGAAYRLMARADLEAAHFWPPERRFYVLEEGATRLVFDRHPVVQGPFEDRPHFIRAVVAISVRMDDQP